MGPNKQHRENSQNLRLLNCIPKNGAWYFGKQGSTIPGGFSPAPV